MRRSRKLIALLAVAGCGAVLARPLEVVAPSRSTSSGAVESLDVPADRYLDLGVESSSAVTELFYRAAPEPWRQPEPTQTSPSSASGEGRYLDLGALAFERPALGD